MVRAKTPYQLVLHQQPCNHRSIATNQRTTKNMHTMHFNCCVCLETKDEDVKQVRLAHDNLICSECVPAAILQPFKAALQHEINYPPMWGFDTVLDFEKCKDLFKPCFIRAWAKRIKEYKTPIQDRIYCQQRVPVDSANAGSAETEFCNTFVYASGDLFTAQCRRCHSWSCLDCRSIVLAPPENDEHFCSDVPAKDDGLAESFDAATRGEAWQECPNHTCLVKMALGSGCNFMTCHFCCTQFCMVCGKKATPDSGHWTRGNGCPRWGGLDAANAMFDDPVHGELDIMVGMVMLPHTDPPTAPTFTLYESNHVHADKSIMTTVWQSFVDEIPRLQWAACEDGAVLKLIDDMRTLLHDLARNLEWVAHEWAMRDPVFEITVFDPVM